MKMKDYYLDLVEEIENIKADIDHLKNIALRKSETSSIWRYEEFDLERITNAEDWAFGLIYHEKLLELGLTMEELVDYIKERREFYENEEKENALCV